MFSNGYAKHAEHADEEVRGMVINPESIKRDLKGMFRWVGRLAVDPETKPYRKLFCDEDRCDPADENRICTVMRMSRKLSTLIYLAGHTENLDNTMQSSSDRLAYAPADFLDASPPARKLIPYEMMRQWLLKNPQSAPLLLVTEVCECDNFLRLPYMLEYEGDEPQWKKTEYFESFPQNSGDIVHLAATSPGELSMSFSAGALFTQAFCHDNLNPSKPLSLFAIAKQLEENINTDLTTWANGGTPPRTQRPRVYCSRVMNEPHFFEALGFYHSPETDSSVGGDSDSNA